MNNIDWKDGKFISPIYPLDMFSAEAVVRQILHWKKAWPQIYEIEVSESAKLMAALLV